MGVVIRTFFGVHYEHVRCRLGSPVTHYQMIDPDKGLDGGAYAICNWCGRQSESEVHDGRLTQLLCDGCNKVSRFTASPDGRVLLCIRCRMRYRLTGGLSE